MLYKTSSSKRIFVINMHYYKFFIDFRMAYPVGKACVDSGTVTTPICYYTYLMVYYIYSHLSEHFVYHLPVFF